MAEVTRVITIQMTTIFDDKEAILWTPEQTEESAREQFKGADQLIVKVQDFVREDG